MDISAVIGYLIKLKLWLSLLISQKKARIMEQRKEYNRAMKLQSEGMGHGKDQVISSGEL